MAGPVAGRTDPAGVSAPADAWRMMAPTPSAPAKPRSSARWVRRFLSRVVMLTVAAVPACDPGKEDPLPTLAGPEVSDLLPRLSGHLVMEATGGRLEVLLLPGRQRRELHPGSGSRGAVHFVSGPNREGHVAYVQNDGVEDVVQLRLMRLDGSQDTLITERRGDALWLHSVSPPALAPSDSRVAVVWNAKPDYHNPVIGPLEVWSPPGIAAGESALGDAASSDASWTVRRFGTASDHGLAWFPDGRRLAYVELLTMPEGVAAPTKTAGFAGAFNLKGGTPVIWILDVESGVSEPLHVGVQPIMSPNGSFMLVRDAASTWWRMDVATGGAERVNWPGDWRGPVALAGPDLLIYWGLPTEGAPIRHTEFGSPLVKKHAMGDLKLAELGTLRFQTILQGVDPRHEVSFGAGAR